MEISLVAAEPLVNTPVAMTTDLKGRLWVAEMAGYMPDTLGTGENIPNGKIVILEDTDRDGVMDKRSVFLDSLVLPRALCLVDNGLLVAEPPRLWYYRMAGDKPAGRVLVDTAYTVGGNVESQTNGLLRGLDNWIYSANSPKRYRKKGDTWVTEPTYTRGQWGITPDDEGRLYYNNNSANVLGDYFTPGFGGIYNQYQKRLNGYNAGIVNDKRVYPIRPTPGVNRGYREGILDDSLRLVSFTAACGPLYYRGGLFGPAYASNVFVAEPAANLIKRNVVSTEGYITSGRQAYEKKEFLASTDERFRPVSLYDGLDGAIYVVDMYRGIIQHKDFITPYLKEEIAKRKLSVPLNYGRIYKIRPAGKKSYPAPGADTPADLVSLLGHPNGLIRDLAQQKLIDSRAETAAPALRELIRSGGNDIRTSHALWTLEGLGMLKAQEVSGLYKSTSGVLKTQAFSLTASVIGKDNYRDFVNRWQEMIGKDDTLYYPYIAFSARLIDRYDKPAARRLLRELAGKQPDNPYLASAIVNNLEGEEQKFREELTGAAARPGSSISRHLVSAVNTAANLKLTNDPAWVTKTYPKGAEVFSTTCQPCHGTDGNGVQNLAPPLNKSEWVVRDKNQLIAIVLYGLTGPVRVNNHLYQAPEISADMPGMVNNPEMTDEVLAELLSFIRKSWQNNAAPVRSADVQLIRKKYAGRQKAFTTAELERF